MLGSDTPRTDALIARHTEESKKPHGAGHALVQVTELIACARQLERELAQAQARCAEVEKDAAYYKWRLKEIIPLFEEARDALPAISLVGAKLHSLDLSLGERMDAAGTRTRSDFDAALKEPR